MDVLLQNIFLDLHMKTSFQTISFEQSTVAPKKNIFRNNMYMFHKLIEYIDTNGSTELINTQVPTYFITLDIL